MKAVIFGSTGMVGNYLTDSISYLSQYEEIIIAVRRPLATTPKRVKQLIVDFDKLDEDLKDINADVVFCCLGTTIAKAKSKDNFRKVDLEYPAMIAKHFAGKGTKRFIVISSIGANAASSNFYLRTKGEMEAAVLSSGIHDIAIVRPGLLLGNREEFRAGERFAGFLMKHLDWLLTGSWQKYRPIHGRTLAIAMLVLAESVKGIKIIESEALKIVAKKFTEK